MKCSVLIGLCLVLLSGCKKDPPVVPEPTLSLAAVDASCIEAWLQVTATEVPATVRLVRDGQPVSVLGLRSPDSLLIDDGLLPNRTYTYQLHKLAADSSVVEISASVQVTTMDTTSSNWSFTIDTLGVTASVLYDVAIISDSNIWAVGELFLRDSSGQLDPILYNATHWDGTRWNVLRIPYIYQGQTFYGALRAVFAFGVNDIWFGSGNMVHWNGQTFTSVELPAGVWGPYLMNKIWGHDGEIYVVGNSGAIAHRSPSGTWRRVESGVTLPIWDIFGARDEKTGDYEIVAVASNHNCPEGRKLLRVQGSSITALPDSGLPWSIDAIWFKPGRKYVVVGDGVYQVNRLGSVWRLIPGLPYLYTTSIAGSRFNDIIIGGAFWNLLHFNGSTLRAYFPFASGSFTSVAIKGNLIVAVGGASGRGIAIRGTR